MRWFALFGILAFFPCFLVNHSGGQEKEAVKRKVGDNLLAEEAEKVLRAWKHLEAVRRLTEAANGHKEEFSAVVQWRKLRVLAKACGRDPKDAELQARDAEFAARCKQIDAILDDVLAPANRE